MNDGSLASAVSVEDRMTLGWEVLLTAAANSRFPEVADELGLPADSRILRGPGLDFLHTTDWSSAGLRSRVEAARDQLREAAGRPQLRALDDWVARYVADPGDTTIKYVMAIERFLRSRREHRVAPDALGLPGWVEKAVRREFAPYRRWWTLFDGWAEESPENRALEWDHVTSCMHGAARRRAFQRLWQELVVRADREARLAFRQWVVAVNAPIGSVEPRLPDDDGVFRT